MSARRAGLYGGATISHDPAMNDSLRRAVARRLGLVLASISRARRGQTPRTVPIRVSPIDPRDRRAFTRRAMRVRGWAPQDRF
jgi:hypothetical protein